MHVSFWTDPRGSVVIFLEERFYHGIMVERAVLLFSVGRDVFLVRDVLPWNHGRTRCSTNCWGSIVFNLAVLPWNYGRTGGSTNFLGGNGF